MKILLPLILLVAAAGAVFWVLAPSDAPSVLRAGAAQKGAAGAPTARAAEPGPADSPTHAQAKKPRSKLADIPTVYPPNRVKPGKHAKPTLAEVAEHMRKAPPPIEPIVPFTGKPRWGRALKTDTPLRVEPKPLKDSIRQYYGNLPKAGPVPVVRLEELLPLDLISELNLPPNGRVIELGSYPIGDLERRGFKEALAIPNEGAGSLGLTVVDDRGESVREYIFTGDGPN